MKKLLLIVSVSLLCTTAVFAAVKHDNYISASNGAKLFSYYPSWNPGDAPTGAEVDENFYIGRQRPLNRFTNTATEVIADSKRSSRKLFWWCPINESGWTSLPRYAFDSEVFNMWQYVDIYGNWTQGLLRQPGAFTDVCHKNGVAAGCVSSAAFGVSLTASDNGEGQNYSTMAAGGYQKLLKLFHYYGIDGIGFNSEQSWGMRDAMKTLIQNCYNNKDNDSYGVPLLHFDFYQFSSYLTGSGTSGTYCWDDFFPYANMFLNYNWGASYLSTSATAAATRGGNSYDVYAGADMQGRSSAAWTAVKDYPVSVGIWGAHNKNMVYQGSNEDGSSASAVQNCYLRKSEYVFSGGTRNPVNSFSVTNDLNSGRSNFFGFSKLVAAKSTLSWQVNSYFPFVTYFNLGNGSSFKSEGVTTYDDEWYNIGIQDFLPTWRWWITDAWLAKNASNVPTDAHATLTYEDAWFGGSCMKISFDNDVTGSNFRFFHLFKTDFPLPSSETWKIRIRYKVLTGSAVGMFALSSVGTETTPRALTIGKMSGEGWQVKEVSLPSTLTDKTLAMIGLRFGSITAGTEILIGEMALYKEGVTYTPVCPTLAKTEILKVTSKGVDFKTTWNSHIDGTSTATTPAVTSCGDIAEGGAAQTETATRATTMCLTAFGTSSNASRYTTGLSVNTTNGNTFTSSAIQSGAYQTVYYDKRGESITVNPGETVTVNVTASGSWIKGSLFVDWTNDGDFADSNEMVARQTDDNYGTFQTSYSFVVPSTTELGTYTLRFITGWNHTDACSVYGGDSKTIASNGGCVVDYELHVAAAGAGGTANGSEGTPTVYHPAGRNAWEPVYNDEVDTWYFEVWGQQCGEEPHMITCTTSWAAYAVEAPINIAGALGYRVGVRAVAPDGVTKSEIQWSSYLKASDITILEGIEIDKPVIKPNETFTVAFEDANHAPCEWEIINSATGESVYTSDGASTSITINGLQDVGSYDVKVCGKVTPGFIQISPEATGAMPEIYTLTAAKDDIEPNEETTVSYTSRNSDGTVSKGLRIGDPYAFAARINDCTKATASTTEFCKTAPYTYCLWFKATDWTHSSQGTNLIYKTDRTETWCQTNWGEFWVQIRPKGSIMYEENNNNWTSAVSRGTTYENELSFNVLGWDMRDDCQYGMTSRSSIQLGVWYHLAVSLDESGNETMWINGKQVAYMHDSNVRDNGCYTGASGTSGGIFKRYFTRLYVGASGVYKGGFNGVIDEIQAWNKVLTTDEVREAMRGYSKENVPSNLKGYWTFDEYVQKDGSIVPSSIDFSTDTARMVFPNWGTGGDYAVGYYTSVMSIADDGSSHSTLIEPFLGDQADAGCPIVPGSYVIETTPTWRSTGGEGSITKGGNTATAGSATVSNAEECNPFRVYLKLTNSWGSSEERYVDLVVDLHTALEGTTSKEVELKAFPNPFVENVSVLFAEEGEYTLLIYNLKGECVNSQTVKATRGQLLNVKAEGERGLYVVDITSGGKTVKAFKLEKK